MLTKQRVIFIIAVVFSALMLFQTLLVSDGWSDRRSLRQDLTSVRTENTEIKLEVERLRLHIEALHRRPEVQEHVIRDELGYLKAGEIVLEIGTFR